MSASDTTDVGFGLGMVFGALTVAAAVYTLVAATQRGSAYGFAAAVALGVVTVAAIHLYWR